MSRSSRWTLGIVSVALFMTALDNLVVGVALPSIRTDLGGSLESLEWTVNAYTLSFAVFLITGAALGDRFGRKRMFVGGLALFTGASALAALAPSIEALVAARAVQGIGAAIVTPLTLTLLSEAVPADKRGFALGIWGGVTGLGVALGPFVGGAVVQGLAWQWIFVLNVPVGLALLPLAIRRLQESHGPDRQLDGVGLGLAGFGLLGLTFGIVRASALGWTSATVLTSIGTGLVLLVAFLVHERRTEAPMLPPRFFASRAFSATNGATFAMFFGTFGSIFLLSQYFQVAQGLSPFDAGLRTLPWTGMPMLVAPIAGVLSDKIGSRPLIAAGLALQGGAMLWLWQVLEPSTAFGTVLVPFVMAGVGMALVFAPGANAVLSAVRPNEAGKASGASNAIREVGGVLGVAVLASLFQAHGGYSSPQAFTDGLDGALPVAAAVLLVGAFVALLIPGLAKQRAHAPAPARPPSRSPPRRGTVCRDGRAPRADRVPRRRSGPRPALLVRPPRAAARGARAGRGLGPPDRGRRRRPRRRRRARARQGARRHARAALLRGRRHGGGAGPGDRARRQPDPPGRAVVDLPRLRGHAVRPRRRVVVTVSGMRPVTVSRTVPQAPEEVFDFLDVLANHERITDHYMTDWSFSGPDRGVGSRCAVTVTLGGRSSRSEIETKAAERPVSIMEESESDGGKRKGRGTYTLAPAPGGGTAVSFTFEVREAPLADRLAGPIARRLIAKANVRVLERLEQELARPS